MAENTEHTVSEIAKNATRALHEIFYLEVGRKLAADDLQKLNDLISGFLQVNEFDKQTTVKVTDETTQEVIAIDKYLDDHIGQIYTITEDDGDKIKTPT